MQTSSDDKRQSEDYQFLFMRIEMHFSSFFIDVFFFITEVLTHLDGEEFDSIYQMRIYDFHVDILHCN